MVWKVVLLTVSGLLLIAGIAIIYGSFRWRASTREMRALLEEARIPNRPGQYSEEDLDDLPAPVQRYFRAVLNDGQPFVSAVSLEHAGTFNMSESGDNWRPFTSDQRVIIRRPGFDWDARIKMAPGLVVRVHDAYIAGEGILYASLSGMIPLAGTRSTPEMARGELMRFLAEAAWYPTVLLPGQGVQWDEVDEYSAQATLRDAEVSVTLLFCFNKQGLIESVRAEERGRTVADEIVPTPWEGRWSDYQLRNGMRIPLKGEVCWVLPEGPRPYWRARLTGISHEFQ